jgi:hypothetical protein
VLGTNSMHRVAEEVAEAIEIPFLHIADATADEIHAHGMTSVGLLGTPLHDGGGLLSGTPRRSARPRDVRAR